MTNKYVVAQLNARLRPLDRGEYFEEPLDLELRKAGCGEVTGGGTLQSETGEIEYCDIEIQLNGSTSVVAEQMIVDMLVRLGAPKGSKLKIEADGREIPFGLAEGLAVYLNGTDLPGETYEQCDSNFVYTEFDRLLEGVGRVLSYWQGPTETAFYMYGRTFAEMNLRLADFRASYPLCARSRVEKVA